MKLWTLRFLHPKASCSIKLQPSTPSLGEKSVLNAQPRVLSYRSIFHFTCLLPKFQSACRGKGQAYWPKVPDAFNALLFRCSVQRPGIHGTVLSIVCCTMISAFLKRDEQRHKAARLSLYATAVDAGHAEKDAPQISMNSTGEMNDWFCGLKNNGPMLSSACPVIATAVGHRTTPYVRGTRLSR